MSEMGEANGTFKLEAVSVTGRTGTGASQSCPAEVEHKCGVELKQSNATTTKKYRLPKGLVGSKCTAVVNIAGIDCNCLLDTGSQITIVSTSFYNQNLSDQPVKPLYDLLEVEGAAGQSVPYLGFVEIEECLVS